MYPLQLKSTKALIDIYMIIFQKIVCCELLRSLFHMDIKSSIILLSSDRLIIAFAL